MQGAPIPRAGGPPILLSYFGAVALTLWVAPSEEHIFVHHQRTLLLLIPALFLIFLTGLFDDIRDLKPKQKLIIQFIASIWACSAGVRIRAINDHPAAAWWAVPLTVAWLVACSNAFNLIDGLDGLAAGIAAFATLTALGAACFRAIPA